MRIRSVYHYTTTVDFCDFVKIFIRLTHIVISKICKNVVIPRWFVCFLGVTTQHGCIFTAQ